MRRSISAITRPLAAVAAAGALVAVAVGCGTDDAATAESAAAGPTKLRVAYVPATTVLPLHVARQQGFFEQQGLDVSLKEAANISDIPATLGRQFDIALGTATDLIKAGGAGVDVVQIAGNTIDTKDNPFVQLMVGK
jgi:NitT/TauT family transport system substrate-binding protein